MDAYRCMFVLCTTNGLCAWHQAIAGPFKHKKLNAKLICDFGICILFFYAVSAGLRVNKLVLPNVQHKPPLTSRKCNSIFSAVKISYLCYKMPAKNIMIGFTMFIANNQLDVSQAISRKRTCLFEYLPYLFHR